MTSSKFRPAPATGIFGGTFDPVHLGHLRAAVEAREILELEDFRLLPVGVPFHRPNPMASGADRIVMLERAVSTIPGFSVDDREVRREGYSYMVDTLVEIRGEIGDVPLMLMIGQDAANALDTWHMWRDLFDLAHLVIMRRPESRVRWTGDLEREVKRRLTVDPDQLRTKAAGLIYALEVTQLSIAATDIRKRLESGRTVQFLLPDPVIDYIEENQLYFAGAARKG